MAALYYFQENSWGLSLPQDVERVAGTGDCTSVHATSPKELRVCCTHAPWEAEEPGLRAFHHDEIQFAQGAGDRASRLGAQESFQGAPTPSPPLGTLTEKAQVQETRLVVSMLDTSTFSSARNFLEGTHACTLPLPDRSNI